MSRVSTELPEKLAAYLHGGGTALLLTTGEDGYPSVAYTWAVAPDPRRVRLGADVGSTTLANLERSGKASLQIIGPELTYLIKGTVRKVKERIAAVPFPISLVEMSVTEARDQSWPGVSIAPLVYEWPADQREAMLKMEQEVYAEMRQEEAGG